MTRYLIKRLLITIPTLLFISFIIFAIMDLAPGDPTSNLPITTKPEVRAQIRETLGVDQPFHWRYARWLRQFFIYEPLNLLENLMDTQLGNSERLRINSWSSRGKPVVDLIAERLPQTLWVVVLAYVVAILIAIPLGTLSAIKRHSWFDKVSSAIALTAYSIPTFFSGLVFIIIFSVNLGWLPSIYNTTLEVIDMRTFLAQIKQLIMPVVVLAIAPTAALTRFTRASVLDNLYHDYVRTARAKGIHEWKIISGHVLRNSLIPIVTLLALAIPATIGGAVITEQIFRINGVGTLLINAVQKSDIPVVTTVTFILAFLVVAFNFIADIIYVILNPQIRY